MTQAGGFQSDLLRMPAQTQLFLQAYATLEPATEPHSGAASTLHNSETTLQAWDCVAQLGLKRCFALRLLTELEAGKWSGDAPQLKGNDATGVGEGLAAGHAPVLQDAIVAWLNLLPARQPTLHLVGPWLCHRSTYGISPGTTAISFNVLASSPPRTPCTHMLHRTNQPLRPTARKPAGAAGQGAPSAPG